MQSKYFHKWGEAAAEAQRMFEAGELVDHPTFYIKTDYIPPNTNAVEGMRYALTTSHSEHVNWRRSWKYQWEGGYGEPNYRRYYREDSGEWQQEYWMIDNYWTRKTPSNVVKEA